MTMKIVVVGGGYAGLACLIELSRLLPESERTLVDPAPDHLKLTRLHEALTTPLSRWRVPFAELGERYGFSHRRARFSVSHAALARTAETGEFALGGERLPCDALVVAVGARPRPRPRLDRCYGLADLRNQEGRRLVADIAEASSRRRRVTVVGGGATGLQYVFQLRDALRRAGSDARLRLVDGGERLLPDEPRDCHDYVVRRLDESEVDYRPRTRLTGVDGDRLVVTGPRGGRRELATLATFVFPGLRGNPVFLDTDESGRVLHEGDPLHRVFAAGDCADYAGPGYDGRTAQAAIRQGLHVAAALARAARGRRLPRYSSSRLGYFVSLGVLDAVGWAGTRDAVVAGLPACAIREAIEARYDLFVSGLDTFRFL
jgi:NADH dehydrogenase